MEAVMTPAEGAADGRRVWFVTGASRGLGRALAEEVLRHGDRLIVTARDMAAIRDLEEADPRRVRAVSLDVTDRVQVEAAIARAVDVFGRLDVVVNNAGYGHFGAIEELRDEDLRAQFEVNVFGLLHVTRAALPQLRRQRSGHIVQMSSLMGVVGQVGGGAYAGSKFAVEGLSQSLADEVGPLGVRVTIVEPGPFRTGFAGDSARVAPPIDDYGASVGAVEEVLRELDGNQPGDPVRAARAIIRAVEADEPPLRLVLGEPALTAIRETLTNQLRELEEWSEVGAATSFSTTG
jgi:NAD(P)-dependent dehydrogenase (short-subunit alcohol dehydrogenase family)